MRLWVANEAPWFKAPTLRAVKATVESKHYPIAEELAALVKAYDGRITLLLLSDYDQAGPLPPDREETVIIDWCERNQVSLVRIDQSFETFRRKEVAPYGFSNSSFNAGHMNATGHQAVAELLTRELQAKGAASGLF